jgi:hypothetical protein
VSASRLQPRARAHDANKRKRDTLSNGAGFIAILGLRRGALSGSCWRQPTLRAPLGKLIVAAMLPKLQFELTLPETEWVPRVFTCDPHEIFSRRSSENRLVLPD